jgi:hypothetical protein
MADEPILIRATQLRSTSDGWPIVDGHHPHGAYATRPEHVLTVDQAVDRIAAAVIVELGVLVTQIGDHLVHERDIARVAVEALMKEATDG